MLKQTNSSCLSQHWGHGKPLSVPLLVGLAMTGRNATPVLMWKRWGEHCEHRPAFPEATALHLLVNHTPGGFSAFQRAGLIPSASLKLPGVHLEAPDCSVKERLADQ